MAKREEKPQKLEGWQALELITRIILRLDGIRLSDFLLIPDYEEELLEKIKEYRTGEKAKKAIIVLREKYLIKTKVPIHQMIGYLMRLADAALSSQSIILGEGPYRSLLRFVNEGLNNTEEPLFFCNTAYTAPVLISERQKQFASSKWWLFFSDRTPPPIEKEGVNRSFILFKAFGRAEIIHYSLDAKRIERYIGSFSEHPNDSRFLVMKMKLKGVTQKYLRITLFINNKKPPVLNLILGQFSNIGKSVYSGSIMLIPARKTVTIDNAKKDVGFFREESQRNKLKKHVWDYFKYRSQNVMRTTSQVTSLEEFRKWHPSKIK